MEKSRNIHNELETLKEDLANLFSVIEPTKEYGATMVLAMLRLHMVEARIHKTRNLKERRRLIYEFTKGKNIIEKGLQTLKERNCTFQIPAESKQREQMSRL
jgi:hypothetical protein